MICLKILSDLQKSYYRGLVDSDTQKIVEFIINVRCSHLTIIVPRLGCLRRFASARTPRVCVHAII